jgi:hypothetical protein
VRHVTESCTSSQAGNRRCVSQKLLPGKPGHTCGQFGDQPDELSEPEKIAQRYALQLSTEHHVGAALYSEAEQAFGHLGLVEITYLTGIYHIVCALLNAFEIPVPGSQADRRGGAKPCLDD